MMKCECREKTDRQCKCGEPICGFCEWDGKCYECDSMYDNAEEDDSWHDDPEMGCRG